MKIKKNDFILMFVILCVAGTCLWPYAGLGRKNAGKVLVKVDGEVRRVYALSDNIEIEIDDTNVCVIENGEVKMIKANCPDQICVNHKAISKNGETIVCLPNRVIIEITSGEKAELDMIAN